MFACTLWKKDPKKFLNTFLKNSAKYNRKKQLVT